MQTHCFSMLDYMAKDMKPTLERLKLVLVLLRMKDPELAQHLLQYVRLKGGEGRCG